MEEFMDWHPFAEKFPLLEGEEWEQFKESVKETKGNEQPIEYRMVRGKKQGMDGRNRERACDELGLKPRMRQVAVKDDKAKDFIIRRNIRRRHMTKELRKEIVAELRADGESTRQIAETLGVPKSTVYSDIKSGVQNGTPAQKSGKTQGKDGKSYPALKPQAGQTQRSPRPQKTSGRILFDWKEFNAHFGSIVRLIDKFGDAYNCGECAAANECRDLLSKFLMKFKAFAEFKQKEKAPV